MTNMSYCRFKNTLVDLKDCLNSLESAGSIENYIKQEDPAIEEIESIKEMLSTINEIKPILNEWVTWNE